jgi:hypothetical protein
MKRIEKFQKMTTEKLADWMMEKELDEKIDYCKAECYPEMKGIQNQYPEGCRKCLLAWLNGEEEDGEV